MVIETVVEDDSANGAYVRISRVADQLLRQERSRDAAITEIFQALGGITHEVVVASVAQQCAEGLVAELSRYGAEDRGAHDAVGRTLHELFRALNDPKPSWETILAVRRVMLGKDPRDGTAITTQEQIDHVLERTILMRAMSDRAALTLTLEACRAPPRLRELVEQAVATWHAEAFCRIGRGADHQPEDEASLPAKPGD